MIALPAGVTVWLLAGATAMRNYAESSVMRSPRASARQVQVSEIQQTSVVLHNCSLLLHAAVVVVLGEEHAEAPASRC
jgi:hypothetical protein